MCSSIRAGNAKRYAAERGNDNAYKGGQNPLLLCARFGCYGHHAFVARWAVKGLRIIGED